MGVHSLTLIFSCQRIVHGDLSLLLYFLKHCLIEDIPGKFQNSLQLTQSQNAGKALCTGTLATQATWVLFLY